MKSADSAKFESEHSASLAKLLTPEELAFLGSHEHRHHATGAPPMGPFDRLAPKYGTSQYTTQTDRAWVVMLYRLKLIPHDSAVAVLKALGTGAEDLPPSDSAHGATFGSGEDWLKKQLGDEDLASIVNYGRTRQEPMSRLLLRDYQLDVIDALLETLGTTLDVADAQAETIMPGSTHMAHAQPTTYGAYVLALHDGLVRGLEQLELAYRHTNQNSLGCGATSGTGWPVDRHMVTELLGFDSLLEPTYQCEGAQDYALTTLFALCNIMTVLSRTSMDHAIWGMEDCGLIRLPGKLLHISSLMPQKAHVGSVFELVRTNASRVIGCMMNGLAGCHGEPLTDVLPIYEAWTKASTALTQAERTIHGFGAILSCVEPNVEKMRRHTRAGFSGAPDLAIKLIREKGYGGRRAHRICAVFVYLARKLDLKPWETTGTLLDEAARIANETPPGLTTGEIREMFDPEKFIQRHANVGDPLPNETRRMIGVRRRELEEMSAHQAARRAKLATARVKLIAEVQSVLDE